MVSTDKWENNYIFFFIWFSIFIYLHYFSVRDLATKATFILQKLLSSSLSVFITLVPVHIQYQC